jgi:pSer/pThr/pTyr-binding forkhead associated (FHA) protein
MDTILEATAGPLRGQRLPLPEGDVITFGRTSKSKIAIPDDKFLSGIHFAVVWKGDSGRLVDHGSSNGTYVNGKKVSEAVLKSGDEIRAGDSIFILRRGQADAATRTPSSPAGDDEITNYPVAPGPSAAAPAARGGSAPPAVAPVIPRAPFPPAVIPAAPARPIAAVDFRHLNAEQSLVVGHWQFSYVPDGWEIVEDYGIQETGKEGLAASAMASEELLTGAMSLDDFVQSQVGSLRGYFREPRIERSTVSPVTGAEDTVALDVRYKTKDGQSIFYRSVYVRRGDRAGMLTMKTLESDLPRAKPVFDKILSSVSFRDNDSRHS